MTQLNLQNAASVVPLSPTVQLTATLADVLTVAASHANIVKQIRASGSDATTGLSVDLVVLKSGGSARYLALAVPVNPGAGVDLWKGTLFLDEGDKLRAKGSTASKIDLTISGVDLS